MVDQITVFFRQVGELRRKQQVFAQSLWNTDDRGTEGRQREEERTLDQVEELVEAVGVSGNGEEEVWLHSEDAEQ